MDAINTDPACLSTEEGRELEDIASSEVAAANKPLPIDKLRVQGSHLISPPPRHISSTVSSIMPPPPPPPMSAFSVTPETQIQIDKQPNLLRRYEFIRRNMVGRTDNSASPTFVIEGKKVDSRDSPKQVETRLNYMSGKISPMDFLLNDDGIPFETRKPILPPKPKSEGPQMSRTLTSVALPVLRINGPGCSQQVGKGGKSLSLPDTSLEPSHTIFVGGANSDIVESDAETKPSGTMAAESLWSEILTDTDSRHIRTVKKNNFFQPAGTRFPETDHSDLCIENCRPNASSNSQSHPQSTNQNGSNKTINLHLQHLNQPKLFNPSRFDSRSSLRDRFSRKPLFHSVSSYLQFNKSKTPPAGNARRAMYGSEPIFTSLDSDRFTDHNILRPLDLHNRSSVNLKKLVAKNSDIAIQSDLHDFFRIKAVK